MLPTRFDSMTREFAERRLTRRAAMATAVGGVATAGFGSTLVTAHDGATPAVSPGTSEKDGVSFMFVQTFGAGSIGPAAESDGLLTMTADHLAGQTLYFSDRPERIVGMVSTERFLGTSGQGQGIDFTLVDPPNAALVLADDRVLVVELIDPTYDPATSQVNYQLRVLDDVADAGLNLETLPLTATEAAGNFEAASLFIDDCANGTIMCVTANGGVFPDTNNPVGYCYNWSKVCCAPCQTIDAAQVCNDNYQYDCGGSCTAYIEESLPCS
jgi:hypothetical protein